MNFPISYRCRLHLWKASEMSHFDNQIGTSVGLASHVFKRRCARQASNCIALGANYLSVQVFTEGVISSGSSLKFHNNRGLRLIWSTEASKEMRM